MLYLINPVSQVLVGISQLLVVFNNSHLLILMCLTFFWLWALSGYSKCLGCLRMPGLMVYFCRENLLLPLISLLNNPVPDCVQRTFLAEGVGRPSFLHRGREACALVRSENQTVRCAPERCTPWERSKEAEELRWIVAVFVAIVGLEEWDHPVAHTRAENPEFSSSWEYDVLFLCQALLFK